MSINAKKIQVVEGDVVTFELVGRGTVHPTVRRILVTPGGSGNGNATVAGNDREIQFNSSGALGASSSLKFTSGSVLQSPTVRVGDGTVGTPSMSLQNATTIGFYLAAAAVMAVAVEGTRVHDYTKGQETSLFGGVEIRYGQRIYPFANDLNLSTALYSKINTSTGLDVITIELEDGSDFHGCAIHVSSYSDGDANFVELHKAGGAGYEGSMYANATRSFISTKQVANTNDCVGFQSIWCSVFQEGLAPDIPAAGNLPNFGQFYAQNSPGNAFLVDLFPGFLDSDTMFRVYENFTLVNQRSRLLIYNGGDIVSSSTFATSGDHEVDAPTLRLRGSRWNGSAGVDEDAVLQHSVGVTGGDSRINLLLGPTGTETALLSLGTTIAAFPSTGVAVTGVTSIQSPSSSDLTLYSHGSPAVVLGATSFNCQTRALTAVGGITMEASPPGAYNIDMQLGAVVSCSSISNHSTNVFQVQGNALVLAEFDPTVATDDTALSLWRDTGGTEAKRKVRHIAAADVGTFTGRFLVIDD